MKKPDISEIEAQLSPYLDTFRRGAVYIREHAWPCACGLEMTKAQKEPCMCSGFAREDVAGDLEDHHEELKELLEYVKHISE